MTDTLPAHLEAIVADVRTATRSAVERSRRRRRRLRVAAVALTAAVLGGGLAAAAGVDYIGLVKRAYPGAEVSDLSEGRQRVLASLPQGRADVVVTDLGVTPSARAAPAGTGVCEWNEGSELLSCSSASGSSAGARLEIPAGTHVYRITAGPGGTDPPLRPAVLYVPELRLQLVVEPSGGGS